MKKIYINGKIADEARLMKIQPGDSVYVCDVPDAPPKEEVNEPEAKETLGSRIKALPWWKKVLAVGGAIAGGTYIASKFAPTVEEDEEDDDESEDEETEE